MARHSRLNRYYTGCFQSPLTLLVPLALFILSLHYGPHVAAGGVVLGVGLCFVLKHTLSLRAQQRADNALPVPDSSRRAPTREAYTAPAVMFLDFSIKNREIIEIVFGHQILGNALQHCIDRIQSKAGTEIVLHDLGGDRYQLSAGAELDTEGGAQWRLDKPEGLDKLVAYARRTLQDLITVDDHTLLFDAEFEGNEGAQIFPQLVSTDVRSDIAPPSATVIRARKPSPKKGEKTAIPEAWRQTIPEMT